MAASNLYPGSVDSAQVVNTMQQKKVLQDVLETIVQLKTDFFDTHQNITDDSAILQRFCAKFEHLLQMGMKVKTSLLGRKKDYWDYFCECLGSSKGSNEGIKYVKSLGENKTSLGRGRAFIRFCLVHQRLADAIQQCIVHEKTGMWYLQGSIFLSGQDSSPLINALYDLNSLQFDLAPRGYDLDSAWPSFSNQRRGGSGSWNIPGRRDSITSMDTLSQISLSMADQVELDKLAKDLEDAQSIKNDLIGQNDQLKQEKTQANQSAWSSHGELQAIQEQLTQLQSQHFQLQDRYQSLNMNCMHLKLDRDHIEKLRQDERNNLKDEEAKRVQQLKQEEMIWKAEMKEENERRNKEIEKLKQEFDKKASDEIARREEISNHWTCLKNLTAKFNIEVVSDTFQDSLTRLEDALQENLTTDEEKNKQLKEFEDQILSLTSQLKDQEQQIDDTKEREDDLSQNISSLEHNLITEKSTSKNLEDQIIELKESLHRKETECLKFSKKLDETSANRDKLATEIVGVKEQRDDLLSQLKEKDKNYLELNQTMKDNLPVFAQNLEESKRELTSSKIEIVAKDKKIIESKENIKRLERDIAHHQKIIDEKESEILKLREESEKMKNENDVYLSKKNDEIMKVKQELAGTVSKLSILIQESEDAERENKLLNEQLTSTAADLDHMKLLLQEADAKLADFENKLHKSSDKLMEYEKMKQELEREKTEIELRSQSMSTEIENLTPTIEILKADAKLNEKVRETQQRDLKSNKTSLENMKKELIVEKDQKMSLLKSSDDMERLQSARMNEVEHQQETLQHEKEQMGYQLDELHVRISQEMEEKVSLTKQLEAMKRSLQHKIDEKDNLVEELKSQIKSLGSNHQEIVKQINKGASKAIEFYNDTVNKTDIPNTDVERKLISGDDEKEMLQRVEEVFSRLNYLCTLQRDSETQSEEEVNGLANQLTVMAAERDLLLKQTDAALDDTQQIKSQLTETSEQLAIAYSKLEIITNENVSLHSKFSHLNNEMCRLEKEKDDVFSEVASLKKACQRAEDETQEKLSEKRDIEIQLEDVQAQLKLALNEKSELNAIVGNLHSQTDFSTNVLEESLKDSKNALAVAVEEKVEIEGKMVNLMAELGHANALVKELKDENDKFKDDVESLKNSLLSEEDGSVEVEHLKTILEQEREDHFSAIELLNQQVSALEFELSSEEMAKENRIQTSSNNEEMQAQINVLESLVNDLQEEKVQYEKRLKEGEGSQMYKSSELHKQIQSQEKEISVLTEKFTQVQEQLKNVTEVKEKAILDLGQLRFTFSAKVEENEEELKTLRSDNSQLKKKVVQLVKDKDSLWQKTDQLVDVQKRKAAERWQDNSTVTKCSNPQCNAEFSLFLRKHHCRKCGRIFCYSCSDFWLATAHSSKKSRVCQACFHQHNNDLDTSVSLIEHDSEDDEEEEKNGSRSAAVRPSDRTSLSNTSSLSIVAREDEDLEPENSEESISGDTFSRINNNPTPIHGGSQGDSPEEGATAKVPPWADMKTSEKSGSDKEDDASLYQMVTEEDVQKSISEYESPNQLPNIPYNMSLSMVLSADDLESGKVNKQNEVWIKPGKMHAVPIKINEERTKLCWEFSSHPKDIVFSIYYRPDVEAVVAEEIVVPCKCNAHKQAFKGELTAKRFGVYTLVFDNTYSRLTSKRVHYQLEYQRTIPG